VLPEAVDIQRSFWLVVHRDVRRIARIDRFIAWLDATIGDLKPLMLGTTPVEAGAPIAATE